MKKLKIVILCGGFSSERPISLKTGKAIYDAIKNKKNYCVELVDLKKESFLKQIFELKRKKIDLAFIALHGKFGEDGKLQSILESFDIKYTGSDMIASCLAMNKHYAKCIFKANNIPTPDWVVITKTNCNLSFNKLNFPLVVKPSSEGSTIGVSIANDKEELIKAINEAFKYDSHVIIEKYIEGKEITVPILGDEVLPLIEIRPNLSKYYDYKSKYLKGGSTHIIPPSVDKKICDKIKEVAFKAAKSIGYKVVCRVDVILETKTKKPYVLEINTIPGMTTTSLLPESAKERGIGFEQLVEKIIELSLNKYK